MDYNEAIARLNMTDRQCKIIGLRMRGYGVKAIATYLGVNPRAVRNAMEKVQEKCRKIDFVPDGENKKRIDRECATIQILEWTAEADREDDADRADSLYAIAGDEAEKHGITSAMLTAERERIAREVSALLRMGTDEADNEAYIIADRYGITSAMLNNV